MPARTGLEYVAGLKQRAAEVYIAGERVKDVTSHPALGNAVHTLASLYDMQHDLGLMDEMTYVSPSTGDRVGLSFIIPRTIPELERRRRMMAHWARAGCGDRAHDPGPRPRARSRPWARAHVPMGPRPLGPCGHVF